MLAAIVSHMLLLAIACGIFHLGKNAPRAKPFLFARIIALLFVLGALWTGHSKLIAQGSLAMPWGVLTPALSAAALVGLVGLEIIRLQTHTRDEPVTAE